jgi:hypothetical protein
MIQLGMLLRFICFFWCAIIMEDGGDAWFVSSLYAWFQKFQLVRLHGIQKLIAQKPSVYAWFV